MPNDEIEQRLKAHLDKQKTVVNQPDINAIAAEAERQKREIENREFHKKVLGRLLENFSPFILQYKDSCYGEFNISIQPWEEAYPLPTFLKKSSYVS